MVRERAIEIIMLLDKKWRGPGGHGWRYRAVYSDDPNGFVGYGDSLREARLELEKQSARSGMRDLVDADRALPSTRG